MELMTKYLVLIFDIKILWKFATTKQTKFALKKLENVFFLKHGIDHWWQKKKN